MRQDLKDNNSMKCYDHVNIVYKILFIKEAHNQLSHDTTNLGVENRDQLIERGLKNRIDQPEPDVNGYAVSLGLRELTLARRQGQATCMGRCANHADD